MGQCYIKHVRVEAVVMIDRIDNSNIHYGNKCRAYKTAIIAAAVTTPTKNFEVGEVVGVQFHSSTAESCVYSCKIGNRTVQLQENQLKCFSV